MLETHSHRSKAGAKAKKDYQKKKRKMSKKNYKQQRKSEDFAFHWCEWFLNRLELRLDLLECFV